MPRAVERPAVWLRNEVNRRNYLASKNYHDMGLMLLVLMKRNLSPKSANHTYRQLFIADTSSKNLMSALNKLIKYRIARFICISFDLI